MAGPDTVSSGSDFFGITSPQGTGAPGSAGVEASESSASASARAGWNLGTYADPHPAVGANSAGVDAAYTTATPITPDEGGGYHLTHPAGGSGEHIPNPNASEVS